MASPNDTTEHLRKEHLPCDTLQKLAASSGYTPYTKPTLSGITSSTLDLAFLHMKLLGQPKQQVDFTQADDGDIQSESIDC